VVDQQQIQQTAAHRALQIDQIDMIPTELVGMNTPIRPDDVWQFAGHIALYLSCKRFG